MAEMYTANTTEEACMYLKNGCLACAGGTNLYVDRHHGKYMDRDLVSLHRLSELRRFSEDRDAWMIGSLVTFSELEQKGPEALRTAASMAGGPQIRNRGTIGGNIVSASPAADLVPVLMVYDAALELQNCNGMRSVSINEFMLGPGKTGIESDELLVNICIPKAEGHALFMKVGKRNAMAISVVNAAVYAKSEEGVLKDIRIALGSVGPKALRAVHAEEFLTGKCLPENTEVWKETEQELRKKLQMDITPIDDIRASASYRRKVAENIVCDMVRRLWDGSSS